VIRDAAALGALLHVLFTAWRLSIPEAAAVLGDLPVRRVMAWREDPSGASVDPVLRRRVSGLLRLHKALRAAYPEPGARRAWLRTAGTGGRTPLERLRAGDLSVPAELRRLLESAGGDPGVAPG
jgi:hypothetical protein